MAKVTDILADDTNQFGPGTDLTISLVALLLVITLITTFEYQKTRIENDLLRGEQDSRFQLAHDSFSAADFKTWPVTELVNPAGTRARVARIADEYRSGKLRYPFIFVIGHSNLVDDPTARDRSTAARRARNMEFALRRATVIASLLQARLHDDEFERLVAVTSGEADLRDPRHPYASQNAWVEVVFGKEWKIPAKESNHAN